MKVLLYLWAPLIFCWIEPVLRSTTCMDLSFDAVYRWIPSLENFKALQAFLWCSKFINSLFSPVVEYVCLQKQERNVMKIHCKTLNWQYTCKIYSQIYDRKSNVCMDWKILLIDKYDSFSINCILWQ